MLVLSFKLNTYDDMLLLVPWPFLTLWELNEFNGSLISLFPEVCQALQHYSWTQYIHAIAGS